MHSYIRQLVDSFSATCIEDYDQGSDPRLQQDEYLTGGGWCFGMAARWIIAMNDGTDFWTWMRTNEAVVAFRYIMARQNMGMHKSTDTDMYTAPAPILKSHGLSRMPSPASMDNWAASGGHSTPLYDKIVAQNQFSLIKVLGNGGHAMAARVFPNGKVQFMDPNAGQFDFDSLENFRNFIAYFLKGWRVFSGKAYLEEMPKYWIEKFSGKSPTGLQIGRNRSNAVSLSPPRPTTRPRANAVVSR